MDSGSLLTLGKKANKGIFHYVKLVLWFSYNHITLEKHYLPSYVNWCFTLDNTWRNRGDINCNGRLIHQQTPNGATTGDWLFTSSYIMWNSVLASPLWLFTMPNKLCAEQQPHKATTTMDLWAAYSCKNFTFLLVVGVNECKRHIS